MGIYRPKVRERVGEGKYKMWGAGRGYTESLEKKNSWENLRFIVIPRPPGLRHGEAAGGGKKARERGYPSIGASRHPGICSVVMAGGAKVRRQQLIQELLLLLLLQR